MEMKAGQFVIFWSTLMHASFPHSAETDQMRLGFTARYVPTRVSIYPDTEWVEEYGGSVSLENYGAVLVNGRNDYGHNRMRATNMRGEPFVGNR
jgi:non-heme Fe2+,alpha-ketoglutarate-dependent halogenase